MIIENKLLKMLNLKISEESPKTSFQKQQILKTIFKGRIIIENILKKLKNLPEMLGEIEFSVCGR